MTLPIGSRSSVGLAAGSGTGGSSGQLQAQQSTVQICDLGYQLYDSFGQSARQLAQMQYRSTWALLDAGVDHSGRQTTGRLEAQGALSFVDGAIFASNTIEDSFAVVDTGGLAKVHVLNENREVGRTDAAGRLLVPDLRAFDINRLSIDPNDIPPDASMAYASRDVRPQDRSGVVVKFPIKISHGALLRLVDGAGVLNPSAARPPSARPASPFRSVMTGKPIWRISNHTTT